MKFDKDMMALLKAMKKASKRPAASIDQRRKAHRKFGLPKEHPLRTSLTAEQSIPESEGS